MTGPTTRAPWFLARCAQAAIVAATVADVFRAVAVRSYHVHVTDASLRRLGLTSVVFIGVMTVTAVLFLTWFGRARNNARAITPGAAPESGAGAVVVWLVPLLNLVAPRRLVLDVRRASVGGGTKDAPSGAAAGKPGRDDVLVNAWWGAWVGHAVLLTVIQATEPNSLPLLVLSEVLIAVAAVLVVLVIQRITTLQDAALGTLTPAEPVAHV